MAKRRGNPFMIAGGPSLNPSGNRTKKPKELKELQGIIRERADDIIKSLFNLAMNTKTPAAVRATCLTALMDRGYGKPLQSVAQHVTVVDQLPIDQQVAVAEALEALMYKKTIDVTPAPQAPMIESDKGPE